MATEWKNVVGAVASCEQAGNRSSSGFYIVFTYKVDGHWYGGTFSSFTSKHGPIHLKYDVARPERNSLVRRERIKNIVIWSILGAVAVSIGVGMLFDQ